MVEKTFLKHKSITITIIKWMKVGVSPQMKFSLTPKDNRVTHLDKQVI